MPSVQRYLFGSNNLARTAALAASSVRASTAMERTSAVRTGGGRVRVAGAYTGHETTVLDVEIVAAGGTPRASVPQFAGVGNGQLAVTAVAGGAAQQTFTLTLADLGVPTATAGLDVREVRLRAKTAGAAGNSLRITVEPVLARAPTAWALLSDWPTGQPLQSGPQWDFGGLPLSATGELDAASPRVQFGFDPQVYRPYRVFKDGAWRFGLSPELERSVPAGTKVYSVTGGYKITVTNGTTTEVYGDTLALQPAIISFHELLAALAASALVEVAGVVAADRAVGGQAAIDVPLRTQSWLLAMYGQVRLEGVSVPSGAPTQAVTITCTNADTVGAERWSVHGDVSGLLAAASTGTPYTSAAAAFTIPAIAAATDNTGRKSFKYSPAPREEGAGVPSVCVRPFIFGANASPLTVTFRYAKRPPADCKCSDMPTPRVSLTCLGIDTGGDMALDPAYQTRLQALYLWRQGFLDSNTATADSPHGFSYIRTDAREVELANGITNSLATTLAEVYESSPATTQWDIELARAIALMAPMAGLSNAGQGARKAVAWSAAAAIDAGVFIRPTAANGRLYRTPVGYTTGATEPDWTIPDPVDNDCALAAFEYWRASTAVAIGRSMEPGNGCRYIVTTAGTTAGTEPSWASASVTDGTAVWTRVSGASKELHVSEDVSIEWVAANTETGDPALVLLRRGDGTTINSVDTTTQSAAQIISPMASTAAVVAMIDARMDYVRTLAGIVPKSDSSSGDAGGCWIDHGDPYWWVDVDGYYLPAFTNHAYVSARRDSDTGKAYSTQEFGFGLVVACPDRLKIGDELTLRIEQVDAARPYRVGDAATIHTIGAGPAWLAGGVDGTDEQTWRVAASTTGALADYVVPTNGGAIPAYTAAGVTLQLAHGGIPFALGDTYTMAIEAGQYRYRRDAGAWSASADIPSAGIATLADGLQLHFEPGAAPSFVSADAYTYRVLQPNAASNVQSASASAWRWTGASATMTLDFGASAPVAVLAMARHTLPPGATATVQLSTDAVTWTAAESIDVSRAIAVHTFADGTAARYVRVAVASATDGGIGFVWAGTPLATTYSASSAQRTRRWAVQRGSGYNPAALYAGAGDGWQIAWDTGSTLGGHLTHADADALLAAVDWSQQHDEPMIFLPHHAHPQDASLVRAAADAMDITDVHEYQPNASARRMLSATLQLDPLYA